MSSSESEESSPARNESQINQSETDAAMEEEEQIGMKRGNGKKKRKRLTD